MPEYHKHFFSANIRMLKIAGLWWLFNKDEKTKIFHYTIMGIYFVFCQLFRTYHNIFDISVIYGDVERLFDHLGMAMSHILMNFKYIVILFYRNKVMKIMDELEREGYEYESISDFNPREISSKQKQIAIRGLLAFFITVCSVPLVGTITSVTLLTIKENVSCIEILPDPTRVPIPMNSYVDCCVAIIVQGIPVLMFGWQIVAADNLYVVLLVCLESHILIVNGAFETIRSRGLLKLNMSDNFESNSCALNDFLEAEMKRLSKHLQLIIRLFEEIEEVFNLIVLMQVIVMMGLGVCSLYMMSSLDIISGDFLHQLLYFMAVSIQVTLYCWIGNEITLTGSTVPLAIYKSDWITASSSFRKGMLINMARMQRNLCITIGKFSPLTVATLVAIFRGSYSYFAVIRKQKMRE